MSPAGFVIHWTAAAARDMGAWTGRAGCTGASSALPSLSRNQTDGVHETGNSHPELAQAVASRLGIPLCQSTVKKFSDNETSVQIGESVREEDVYIIQVR